AQAAAHEIRDRVIVFHDQRAHGSNDSARALPMAFNRGILTSRPGGPMRQLLRLGVAIGAFSCLSMASAAALEYPLPLTAQAKYGRGPRRISSAITIRVERLIDPAARTRVLDRLKYNGYQGFMTALRPLPVVGQVSSPNAHVDLRYAWETKADDRTRLIL